MIEPVEKGRLNDMGIGKAPWSVSSGYRGATDRRVKAVEFDLSGDELAIVLEFESLDGRPTNVCAPITRDAVERLNDHLPTIIKRLS